MGKEKEKKIEYLCINEKVGETVKRFLPFNHRCVYDLFWYGFFISFLRPFFNFIFFFLDVETRGIFERQVK